MFPGMILVVFVGRLAVALLDYVNPWRNYANRGTPDCTNFVQLFIE